MIKHRYKPPTITQHARAPSSTQLQTQHAHRYTQEQAYKRAPKHAHPLQWHASTRTQAPKNARAYTHAHAYKRTQEKNEKKPSVIGWVSDQCIAIAITLPFSDGIPHAWPLPVHDPHAPGHGKTLISPMAFRIAAFVSCVP